VFSSSTIFWIFLYVILYIKNRKNHDITVDNVNFYFCVLTSIISIYGIYKNLNIIIHKSIIFTKIEFTEEIVLISLGYLIIDLSTAFFFSNMEDPNYFYFHLAIFFSYGTVLLRNTGQMVIILTLLGEVSSLFSHFSYNEYLIKNLISEIILTITFKLFVFLFIFIKFIIDLYNFSLYEIGVIPFIQTFFIIIGIYNTISM
jgi:hypothetical protein